VVVIVNKMRIVDGNGQRLYLNLSERKRFIKSSRDEVHENRMFCHILHDTGCRLSEAIELTPDRIMIETKEIQFRSLKKRKYDMRGNLKLPEYRTVPVTENLIELLDLTFNLKILKNNEKTINKQLFTKTRNTYWRIVKGVMKRAGIKGKMAVPKGLRHGFAIALLVGEKPAPIHIVSQVLGHSNVSTTEIYLQAIGEEKRQLVMQALEL